MAKTREAESRRNPGRPAEDRRLNAREALLDAASRLFAAHGVQGVSLRRIADEAGVTPAMVHYYFGNKEGLYDAMLSRAFARILEAVRTATADGGQLEPLLQVLLTTVTAEPWIPTLVIREVLTEGGRLRDQFVKGYASHMAVLLPSLIQREIDAGKFREDLDPTLSFLSLIGMSVMPFVARPVVERVLGINYDQRFVDVFAAHTHRLFVEGAKA